MSHTIRGTVELSRLVGDFSCIADHMHRLAVRRSFEIWERLSHADVLRGLGARPGRGSFASHVSGVIGCANGRDLVREGRRWRMVGRGWLRSYKFRPLSPQAVAVARSVAGKGKVSGVAREASP